MMIIESQSQSHCPRPWAELRVRLQQVQCQHPAFRKPAGPMAGQQLFRPTTRPYPPFHSCMAARPAAGRSRGFVHFFARSARHILVEKGTRSSFTLPSTSLFSSTSDINSKVPQQQQLPRHRNNISNLHSAFDISSRRSQQNIYIDVRERRPLRQRRACCSAARPHRFVGATLLNLRCVEHVSLDCLYH